MSDSNANAIDALQWENRRFPPSDEFKRDALVTGTPLVVQAPPAGPTRQPEPVHLGDELPRGLLGPGDEAGVAGETLGQRCHRLGAPRPHRVRQNEAGMVPAPAWPDRINC